MRPQRKKNSLEVRFNRILSQLSNCRVMPKTKGLEMDIAYMVDHIQRHGFEFFPGFYLYEDIQRLDKMVKELQNEQGIVKYSS